jgi:hypothetical protein
MNPAYVVALITAGAQLTTAGIGVLAQSAGTEKKSSGSECISELSSLAEMTERYPNAARLVANGIVRLDGEPGCAPPRLVVNAFVQQASTSTGNSGATTSTSTP